MTKISFKGKIADFHPTKSNTVKVTIETVLDVESAKLLWFLDKGLSIVIADNQATFDEERAT